MINHDFIIIIIIIIIIIVSIIIIIIIKIWDLRSSLHWIPFILRKKNSA